MFKRRQKSQAIAAKFQRNSDGQFVGKMDIDDLPTRDCWLVFEHESDEPSYLTLTFTDPYKKP